MDRLFIWENDNTELKANDKGIKKSESKDYMLNNSWGKGKFKIAQIFLRSRV
jgi:hypothetical protein